MGIYCPNCNSISTELLACDSCQIVGCVRCVTKLNKQWLCHNCKTGKPIEDKPVEKREELKKESSDLFSMFG